MRSHLTGFRTTLLVAVLAVLFVACDESPSATKSLWQLDSARFPVVLERRVNVVAQADGSGVSEVPPDAAPEPAPEGLVSPDGRRSALIRDESLFIQERGEAPRPVEIGPLSGLSSLSWSPDSGRLLFQAAAADGRVGVYVVGADGSGIANVSGDLPGFASATPGWSPDGRRIAFFIEDAGGCPRGVIGVYVVSADGTGRARVGEYNSACGDATHDQPAWSPNGRRIAVVSAGTEDEPAGTRVFDASGGPVLNLGGGGQFSWSPDGQSIAYGELDPTTSRVVVVDLAAPDAPRYVTDGFWPRWSPAGDRIAFKRGQNPTNVYSVRSDGSGIAAVADDGEYATSELTWLANGQRLELVRSPLTGQRFYAVDLRDGSFRRSATALGMAPNVDLSPDHQSIAFSGEEGVLFTMDTATDELTALTPPGYAGHVDWSPDGRVLALATMDALYVADGNSGSLLKISEDDATGPIWSPDGQRIAYVRFDSVLHVVIVRADGSDRHDFPAGGSVGELSWSEDGASVAYATDEGRYSAAIVGGESRPAPLERGGLLRRRSPEGGVVAEVRYSEPNMEVWVREADSQGGRRVVRYEAQDSCCPPELQWSPDGTKIAATFSAGGSDHGVHVIDVHDGVSILAATTEGNCRLIFVGWSADSGVIYVVPECFVGI